MLNLFFFGYKNSFWVCPVICQTFIPVASLFAFAIMVSIQMFCDSVVISPLLVYLFIIVLGCDITVAWLITAGASSAYAAQLAAEIEGISARAYTAVIAEAAARGEIRRDVDAPMLAFFFDNLLLMLQFSYSCDYYRSRFQEYCGDAAADEAYLARQMTAFIQSAFGPKKEEGS